MSDNAPQHESQLPLEPDADSRRAVLLAEDDPFVREVGRRMLQEADFHVLCASDGEEALDLFVQNADRIDLVLLDVVLPRIGGRKVFEGIRRLQLTTPIVFCTGYDLNSVQGDELRRLGNAVLTKPFDQRQLLSVVAELTSGVAAVAVAEQI